MKVQLADTLDHEQPLAPRRCNVEPVQRQPAQRRASDAAGGEQGAGLRRDEHGRPPHADEVGAVGQTTRPMR